MTDISRETELQAREAEAEEARARLSRTLDTLTSPETQDAVKAQIRGYAESYKDELLKQADRYKDELLQRADEYKIELLHRAGEYKDEALERARDASRETIRNVTDDLKQRAMNNPAAVALIGAGIGWRLYKHPPITTLLVGTGLALLMRTPGRSGQGDRSAYRDPYRETQPRGYGPGGVAGYGYPVEESAPGSSTAEQVAAMAATIGETARDAGTRVRDAAADAASRLSEAAAGARARMTDSVGDATGRAGGLAETVRQNPVLLGVLALVAGAAVSRSVRATETGERFLRGGTDALGRRAWDVTSRAGSAARHTVEVVSGMASTAGSTVSDTVETVRSRVGDIASDLTDAAGRALDAAGNLTSAGSTGASSPSAPASSQRTRHRRDQGMPRSAAGLGEQARGELLDMAQRYPLLLGSVGLAIGMAAGAAFRPTAAEDRYVGRASDALKRRAQQRVAGQLDKVLTATNEVIASMEKHLGERTGAHQEEPNGTTSAERTQAPGTDAGVGSPPDVDTTAVVVERAEDAVAAQAAMGKKKPAPRSRKKRG